MVYKYITDHLGSVRFVVNLNTGAIVQELDYDEFGKVLKNTNESFQPFTYAGGLCDVQTGLIRFGARDYDAMIGRWTAKDPIGFMGKNINLYIYIANNPLNSIDITGRQSAANLVEQLNIVVQAYLNTKKYKKDMETWKEIIENPELIKYIDRNIACLAPQVAKIHDLYFSTYPYIFISAPEIMTRLENLKKGYKGYLNSIDEKNGDSNSGNK